jgi:hypothetical protein
MLIEGDGCGVDLVKQTQLGGDLENSWMMFDHVKRVQGWTTMACHVCDLVYCKVMSITICDMQSKDIKAQFILWKKLNAIILKKGVTSLNFKSFMAYNAQANWNVVSIVYGTGDPTVKFIDKERTCLFHWTQSLDMHTKQLIAPKFQDRQKDLCYDYKKAKSLEEANVYYVVICFRWYSSRVATKGAIHELNN